MVLELVDKTAPLKRPAEFRSELENLMPANELDFEATPGFGKYRRFLDHAVAHPAKINQHLLEYLILTYTKEGDTILDPMAGTGSTGVQAALNGRNTVCVDIEEKFYQWMEQARKGVEASESLTKKGWMRTICGDSRNLSTLLIQKADSVITSPPYAETKPFDDIKSMKALVPQMNERTRSGKARGHPRSDEAELRYLDKLKDGVTTHPGNIAHLAIDSVITSPPYSEGIGHAPGDDASHDHEARLKMQQRYTRSMKAEENIAALKHGDIDTVITSPPYSESLNESKNTTSNLRREDRLRTAGHDPAHFMGGTARDCQIEDGLRYSHNPDNIGNLKHGGVDAIITSPPYGESAGSVYDGLGQKVEKAYEQGKVTKDQLGHFKGRKAYYEDGAKRYGDSQGQIGETEYGRVDAVITSPPYADTNDKKNRKDEDIRIRNRRATDLPPNPENIGNLAVDAVITSPPYGEALSGGGIARNGYDGPEHGPTDLVGNRSYMPDRFQAEGNISNLPVDPMIQRLRKHGRSDPKTGGTFGRSLGHPYSSDQGNIGNLKSVPNEEKIEWCTCED